MTETETQGLKELQQEVINAQNGVPMGSLDWSIYQGQLDLLEKVGELVGVRLSRKDLDQRGFREHIRMTNGGKTTVVVDGKIIGAQG